jgi:hypothetical protein
LPSLGFARRHGDEAAIQINLAPIEPLQFGCPQAREGTEGQVRPHVASAFLSRLAMFSGVKIETEDFVSLYRTMPGNGL